MKLTVIEPGSYGERWLPIHFDKNDAQDRIVMRHGDTMNIIGEIACGPGRKQVEVQLVGSDEITIKDDDGKARKAVVRKFDERPKGTRNWVIADVEEPTGNFIDEVYPAETDENGMVVVPERTERVPEMRATGKKELHIWLGNGNRVTLPIADKPGRFTPMPSAGKPIHEIVGQDRMLFSIALGMKLGKNTLMTGPTGIGKTSIYIWLAHVLNWNLIVMPISRGTQDLHMKGEFRPYGPGEFRWADGPVSMAVRESQNHPTILVFDEINRIGNVAEFATIYSLLDDQHMLELPEKRDDNGDIEVLHAGELYIGATANPVDDDGGDYIGVKELDPAFARRFPMQPRLGYPEKQVEAAALCSRVETLDKDMALKLVSLARVVRESEEVRFPMSFSHLEAWALTIPYYGYAEAAELSVIQHAPFVFRPDLRNLLQLQSAA